MIEPALWAQLLLWLAVLGIFLSTSQATYFHPALWYLGFHGLVFVLRPLLVHYLGFDSSWHYMWYEPDPGIMIRTLAVASVGLVAFVTVCTWVGRTSTRFRRLAPPVFTPQERQGLLLASALLTPIIAWSIYATRQGIERDMVSGIQIMTNSTGYLNDAQCVLAPLLCAWLAITRFHWLNLLPVGAYLAYRSWFGWSRWTIVLFFLMVVAAYCWHRRLKWVPLWSLILALPLLALFNSLGHNREYLKAWLEGTKPQTVEYVAGLSRAEQFRQRLDTQDFANFDYLTYIVGIVPERTGTYTYGLQYLQLLTEPIPRILWRGKPVGAPVRLINIGAYGNFVGLTVSLAGDGWISGGWVGLVLTLGFAGAVTGWAHRQFWRCSDRNLVVFLYLGALAMLPQWFRDGGISIFKFMLWTWLPLLLWWGATWVCGPRLWPAASVVVPGGAKLRLVEAGDH